jgi:hypothetical protein
MAKDRSQSANPLAMIGGAAGAAAGYAVSQYTGPMALIPLGGTLLFGLLAAKVVRPATKPMVPGFAVQVGQLLWFIIGAVATGQYRSVLLDLIILAIGLVWLLARPGLGPVLLLGIYQGISFVINAAVFASTPIGSVEHKALLVHLIFRAAAVVLMIAGLRRSRTDKTAEDA